MIHQNAKHGQTIKKLYKWAKCAALQEVKYNTRFLKIILLAYQDTYAVSKEVYNLSIEVYLSL